MPPIQPSFLVEFEEYAATMPEIPKLYNRWAAVMAVAASLGKNAYLKRGHFLVYPNLYVMLIGSPGTGKGTICGILQTILSESGYTAFAANKSTKEKFIQDLADGFNFRNPQTEDFDTFLWDKEQNKPSECLILAEEFNGFIGSNNLDFVGLLTELWSFTGNYRNRLKTGKSVEIYDPCINLFGGNTHSGFAMAFPPEVVGQGFLARMLLVYGEGTGKRVSFPEPPPQEARTQLVKRLMEIRYGNHGEYNLTEDAKRTLDDINQGWNGFSEDLRFQHYGSRRFTQLLKLCLIHAAATRSREIERYHVIESNTLLCDTEDVMQKALGEFGKARNSDVNSKVMQALHAADKPLDLVHLWKLCCNDLEKMSDLATIIQNLTSADKIQHVKGKGWLPKNMERKRDTRHTKPTEY